MASDLGKRDFSRPAANEPAEDIERVCVEISAQECLRLEFSGDVADQHVTDGHHAAGMMPDGGGGDDVDQALARPYQPVTLRRSQRVFGSARRAAKVG